MRLSTKVLSAVIGIVAFSQSIVSHCVSKAMEENQIVPDVIDVAPRDSIQVIYPSGVSVDNGKELTPRSVKDVPTVTYTADEGSFYTLIKTDPDAPSRKAPALREIRHWLVVNIPGNKVQDGDHHVEYIGSGAPEGTGLHRYIFLLFKQPGKITLDEPRTTNRSRVGRVMTNTREFAKKYNLGNPIAGNFYQAQYDDYVPILHAQLSGN